ncbi:MAG: hypothetical protein L6Q40_00070 [Azonexus sp.]|nr:hypothetical protein [Azonexus sp.]
MRTSICLMLAACLTTPALATDSARLSYRNDWPNGNPRALTLISAKMPARLPLGQREYPKGVDWVVHINTVPRLRQRLCQTIYPAASCIPFVDGGIRVAETYLGDVAKYVPYRTIGTPEYISTEALIPIGAGGTRMLALTVEDGAMVRRALTIAFDPVSDDELRDIALEDAVYRILRLRED